MTGTADRVPAVLGSAALSVAALAAVSVWTGAALASAVCDQPPAASSPGTAPDASRPDLACLSSVDDRSPGLAPLRAAIDRLLEPRSFRSYFETLMEDSGVAICLDAAQVDCRGSLEPDANRIAISTTLDEAEIALILAHELRHLDQRRRGFGLSLDHAMTEHVRLTYALEADAQAFMLLVAWEAKGAGDPDLWTAAAVLDRYEDTAAQFSAAMERTGNAAEAMAAAFATWYESPWRLEAYRRSAAGNYLDALDDAKSVPSFRPYPPAHLEKLCTTPDGSSYGCRPPVDVPADR